MPDWPLALRRAAPDHVGLIVHLIDDAAAWLRTQGTDQWAKPWPTRAERHRRVMAHLRAGKTWIAWDACTAAATITFDPDADPYWPQQQLRDPAVYIHRLVVSRHYAGAQLGAGLLDWAGRTARRDHGARWIRLNAWTTNHRLHQYYARLGFRRCAACDAAGYPSAALFQRPAEQAKAADCPRFREVPPAWRHPGSLEPRIS